MAEQNEDEPDAEEERMTPKEARAVARAELPATYVDTWATLTWSGHIRIALGESFKSGPRYRAAFVMTLDEAKELAEYLLETVEERMKKDVALNAPITEDD